MFKRWQFKFTPPKTVPAPAGTASIAPGTTSSSLTSVSNQTRAGQVVEQLKDLIDASTYLQNIILARTDGMGVEIDPSIDPNTARYLEQTYAVSPAPNAVTIPMYNHLLNAELGYLPLESALGTGKTAEADGFALAAQSWITNTVENHLITAGDFKSQVPLLLRGLKGDQIIFQQWIQQLQQYPAYSSSPTTPLQDVGNANRPLIPTKNVDLSPDLHEHLTTTMGTFSSMYASTYQLLAGVGVVESDIVTVLGTYVTTPVEDLIRMVAILQGLRGVVHKYRMKDVMDSLSAFAFIRMACETAELQFQLDRLATIAVNPMKTMVSRLGTILGAVRGAVFDVNRAIGALGSIKGAGQVNNGALKGVSELYNCGLPHNANVKKSKVVSIPGLDKLTSGLAALGSHLDWGIREINSHGDKINESFRKLAARRLQDRAAQLDLICSTQALDTLTNLAKAIINNHQKGLSTTSQDPNQRVEAVGKILTSISTGSDTQFAIQNGAVVATPPSVPNPPDNVETVLRNGGLNRVTTRDLQSLKGVLA